MTYGNHAAAEYYYHDSIILSVNYCLQALSYDPNNREALRTISNIVNYFRLFSWRDDIKEKAQLYDNLIKKEQELENKKQALEKFIKLKESIPQCKKELQSAEMELSDADKQDRWYFTSNKVKKAKEKVTNLKNYIVYLEGLKSPDDL